MKKVIRYKYGLLFVAVLIIAITAVISPEHAETVAKAFMVLFGVSF